jgi:hypothetical protein
VKRIPTNFGPYENEYRARVPRQRRLLGIALQLALVAIGVVLAGFFLFPMSAPINDGFSDQVELPARAASAPASAPNAPNAPKARP